MCHRSALRQDKRAEALKECVKMITAQGGGCCTVFPYEAAIWLLEEQEELVGTNKRPVNRCCTRLPSCCPPPSPASPLSRGSIAHVRTCCMFCEAHTRLLMHISVSDTAGSCCKPPLQDHPVLLTSPHHVSLFLRSSSMRLQAAHAALPWKCVLFQSLKRMKRHYWKE